MRVFLFLISHGLFTSVSSYMMAGTSPSVPNPILKKCMLGTGYYNISSPYRNQFAAAVDKWCSVYKRVIPCVENSFQGDSLQNTNDWYSSLIFDKTKAIETTQAMCPKLKKISRKMSCMRESNIMRVITCISSLTNPVRRALEKLHHTRNNTDLPLAKQGACLISASAATCYHESLKSCRRYVRNFVGAYNIILGGKCVQILSAADDIRVDVNMTEEQKAEREWMSTVNSLLKSDIGVTAYPANEKQSPSPVTSRDKFALTTSVAIRNVFNSEDNLEKSSTPFGPINTGRINETEKEDTGQPSQINKGRGNETDQIDNDPLTRDSDNSCVRNTSSKTLFFSCILVLFFEINR